MIRNTLGNFLLLPRRLALRTYDVRVRREMQILKRSFKPDQRRGQFKFNFQEIQRTIEVVEADSMSNYSRLMELSWSNLQVTARS